ncbi:hypothetical protein MHYP_G00054530 [Metynnis hypsauchen]
MCSKVAFWVKECRDWEAETAGTEGIVTLGLWEQQWTEAAECAQSLCLAKNTIKEQGLFSADEDQAHRSSQTDLSKPRQALLSSFTRSFEEERLSKGTFSPYADHASPQERHRP